VDKPEMITPLQPHQVLEAAIGHAHAKGVAIRMNKHVNTIYKMFEDPEFDRYSRFLQMFLAIYAENSEGAEMLFEDFRARVSSLRHKNTGEISTSAWYEQVARCEKEHSEGIRAAILSRDTAAIRKEIAEDIAEKRALLEMLQTREQEQIDGLSLGHAN
jgi:hypothetical protein